MTESECPRSRARARKMGCGLPTDIYVQGLVLLAIDPQSIVLTGIGVLTNEAVTIEWV
jgi:hypothetical protein